MFFHKETQIGDIKLTNALILAPLEGITDAPFRIIARELGAEIVYSEFISSRGILQKTRTSLDKAVISEREPAVALQVFGNSKEILAEAAKKIEDIGADILDINCGCWVWNVCKAGSGAALLRNPDKLAEIARAVSSAVSIPVTIKTRLGWGPDEINIVEAAEKLKGTGLAALAVHCRTRDQAMRGAADWSLIPDIKKAFQGPVILNGDVRSPESAFRAFKTKGCDGLMIGRGAVGNPFVFKKIKLFLETGSDSLEITPRERIDTCLEHLGLSINFRGYPRALYEFRKHYAGYLKGLYNAGSIRDKLVISESLGDVKSILKKYLDMLEGRKSPYSSLEFKTRDNLTKARGVF